MHPGSLRSAWGPHAFPEVCWRIALGLHIYTALWQSLQLVDWLLDLSRALATRDLPSNSRASSQPWHGYWLPGLTRGLPCCHNTAFLVGPGHDLWVCPALLLWWLIFGRQGPALTDFLWLLTPVPQMGALFPLLHGSMVSGFAGLCFHRLSWGTASCVGSALPTALAFCSAIVAQAYMYPPCITGNAQLHLCAPTSLMPCSFPSYYPWSWFMSSEIPPCFPMALKLL